MMIILLSCAQDLSPLGTLPMSRSSRGMAIYLPCLRRRGRAQPAASLPGRTTSPYHTANSPCASRRVKCRMPASSRSITSATGLRTSSSPTPSARMT
jgi:hypothetical protein